MKLNRFAQIIIAGTCVIALTACAPRNRNASGQYMADNSSSDRHMAQATGVGENENFGDSNKMAMHIPGKAGKTYYFAFDRFEVRDSDKAAIYANADYLVAHPKAKIILEGHTDPRGSREYNVALGERRADAVVEMLKSRGVNPNQIRIVSYGAQKLASAGRSEEDFQLDRRAMIVTQR